eukprot:318477-Pelagomonas_calceolata.AAC.5
MGSRGGVGAGHGKNGMNGVGSAGACRGKQKGGGGGGDNSIDSDDDVCAGLVQGANKLHDHGASKGGSPVGSVASGEGDEYDGEEDLMDMLRWLWGHRSSEDGMEAGSEEEGHEEEEESTDELDEDRGGERGETRRSCVKVKLEEGWTGVFCSCCGYDVPSDETDGKWGRRFFPKAHRLCWMRAERESSLSCRSTKLLFCLDWKAA